MNKVNIYEEFKKISDFWDPRIIGQVNEMQVKLAKVKGVFVKHHHEENDELFMVLKGKLKIEIKGSILELNEGEIFIVPKDTEHKPYAEEETYILLFESKETLNTGNVINDLTKFDLKRKTRKF